MLSSISRDTAWTRSVSVAVGGGSLRIWLLSGWNASGMNAWKPPVSSCSAARPQHVIDALLVGLDVAVEHRHVRPHAELVRDAVDGEVAVGVRLVVRDLLAHARREDLGSAAGQRVEPGLHQPLEHLAVGHPVDVGEERDLDGGEALQVNPGPDLLQPAQHVGVVLERQVRDGGR